MKLAHVYAWLTAWVVGTLASSTLAQTPPPSGRAGEPGPEPPAVCMRFPLDAAGIRREAELGDAYCQAVLGAMYWRGISVEPDEAQALHWSRLAWEVKHPLGMYNHGRFLKEGIQIPADREAALAAFRAARAGFAAAAALDAHYADTLAYIVYEGADGSAPDHERGCALYKQAAEQGNCRSQYLYAHRCLRARASGEGLAEAIHWYQQAAAGGLASAAWELGDLHRADGHLDAARAHYQRAAEIGSSSVKLRWGTMLESGALGEADAAAALSIYLRAAGAGSVRAQLRAAWIYYAGAMNVPRNVREARRRFKAAAHTGDPDALNMLSALGIPLPGK